MFSEEATRVSLRCRQQLVGTVANITSKKGFVARANYRITLTGFRLEAFAVENCHSASTRTDNPVSLEGS